MTTPRRLRKDGRKRTPKMIAVTAAKARLRRAGSVATVSRDWHVIWPQKSKPLDVTPVAYDKAPSPHCGAGVGGDRVSALRTDRKGAWRLDEIEALQAEVDAAYRAASIASDIVVLALRYKDDPEVFYANVASAYRRFSLVTGKPTTNIAMAADVSYTTAARWVRVARRRGHLDEEQVIA